MFIIIRLTITGDCSYYLVTKYYFFNTAKMLCRQHCYRATVLHASCIYTLIVKFLLLKIINKYRSFLLIKVNLFLFQYSEFHVILRQLQLKYFNKWATKNSGSHWFWIIVMIGWDFFLFINSWRRKNESQNTMCMVQYHDCWNYTVCNGKSARHFFNLKIYCMRLDT